MGFFKSGPTAAPVMVRKLRNLSLLSKAVITTRIAPFLRLENGRELAALPEGRIDQRTIWPKTLS